ncbi:receptor-like protein EIX2 [Lycium barbarum]|uniref:receptor-like protein EIX2 n=1 Tax=Lycium barbarum TaxID=112863 RepID=UPI00293E134A|nr:receptor-like protein EIX2 [Lycium barbarum]
MRLMGCLILSTYMKLTEEGIGSTSTSRRFELSTHMYTGDLGHFPIPEAFGYMKRLEVINLAANTLEGGLPKSFGNLSHLKTLSLSLNKMNRPLSELFLRLSDSGCQILCIDSSTTCYTSEGSCSQKNLSETQTDKIGSSRSNLDSASTSTSDSWQLKLRIESL